MAHVRLLTTPVEPGPNCPQGQVPAIPPTGCGRRRLRALASMGLLLLLGLLLAGCGDGLSGGSVPPGRSSLVGAVVEAENPLVGIPNAIVTIYTTAPNGSTTTYRVYSGPQGGFAVDGIPTGRVYTNVTVVADPGTPDRQKQTITFPLANGRQSDVLVSLPLSSVDLSHVAHVSLQQTVESSGAVQISPRVLDQQGNVVPLFPTVIIDGATAVVGPDGTLTVSGASVAGAIATATVTATVETGSTASPSATTSVPLSTQTGTALAPGSGGGPPSPP